MYDHLVLFKIKQTATPEQVEAMLAALRGLRHQIDGIVDLSCGTNTSERSGGFTHGLCVRFESKAALEAYLPHPAHKQVVHTLITPILDELIVVDYPS